MMGTMKGSGDTLTLHNVIKFVWIFCTQMWWGLSPIKSLEIRNQVKGDLTGIGIFPVDSGLHQISSTVHGGDQLPLGKSVNIRSILRSDHPYIKYNYAILFLGQMSSLSFYASKSVF